MSLLFPLFWACVPARTTGEAPPPQPEPAYTSVEVAVPAGWSAAPLRLTLDDGGGGVKLVEVSCSGSGFRKRAPLVNGQVDLGLVPVDDCALYFKGGAPAQFSPVSGGQSLSCKMVATTALCEPLP